MNIREDNITYETLTEDLAREKVTLKEYVARSEYSTLFTTTLNKKVLDNWRDHPSIYKQVCDTVTIGDGQGRNTYFPTLYGINPEYVPELGEIPFGDIDTTGTDVEVIKFGMRMGISQEMIDDNEVGLIGWIVKRLGQRMGVLRDQEFFKMLHTYHSTGAAADGSLGTFIGNRNRGAYYTTGAFTLGASGSTPTEWSVLIGTALRMMKAQTITIRGDVYRIPVYGNTLLCHTRHELGLAKLLRSATQILATGLSTPQGAAKTLLAGSNVWRGVLNLIATPYCPDGGQFITEGTRGSIMMERKAPTIDRQANWAFDAQEVKSTTRFIPAVIEERSILAINGGTA